MKPLEPGDTVLIPRHIALPRDPQIEGRGRLIAPVSEKMGLWRVTFDGERNVRVRLIHSIFQRCPDEILHFLSGHHCASVDPTLLIDPIDPFGLRR